MRVPPNTKCTRIGLSQGVPLKSVNKDLPIDGLAKTVYVAWVKGENYPSEQLRQTNNPFNEFEFIDLQVFSLAAEDRQNPHSGVVNCVTKLTLI